MLEFIASFELAPVSWFLLIGASALIGMNKTGLAGLSLIAVPILAAAFGGKASTGLILPLLIAADSLAIFSYRKSICWKAMLRLIPWTLPGLAIALYVGDHVSDHIFKICIAAVVFIVLMIMVIREIRGGTEELEPRWYLTAGVGLIGGFAAMIGNVAGPIVGVYFLSMSLNKNEFIATRAWFFWIINIIKLPLQIFIWREISVESLELNLIMLPAIFIGAAAGVIIVKRIADRPYRIFLITITAVSAVLLLF
ncbi:MAG: sulfite exporter TauE/SafE family protein [Spirochaetales bacterium]|uniref:Probable membrane transporter protein n=1 Tax=Candidatus Thalassospirochaeta sargassi TaxID=3119039 RepID=A0AAJ1IEG8_9SPIO|nr:sulfite exporter TauE/SafE family protein [Spirochaetales bacterium]